MRDGEAKMVQENKADLLCAESDYLTLSKIGPAELPLRLLTIKNENLQENVILVLVSHPDDEVIGPGATLATLSDVKNIAIFFGHICRYRS